MENSNSYVLKFEGDLRIRQAAEVAASLLAALEANPAVAVATDDVTGVDVSILQLLIAADKTAANTGKTIKVLTSLGSVFRHALIKAGLLGTDGEPLTSEVSLWGETVTMPEGKTA